ncbi:SDR family oxidoreductase [Halovivax limisalsi]|uniref:SDR family oxidoreductase n=1 Tax=Halovivax limisalsi TaxID=1453760 RepID=UPI001FFC374A|nr:SDR family oxidoreductase [Halovivax limisalsi]
MDGVADSVGLVTGAGSGIGRATATRFAEAGANVAVVDIDEDGGRETVAAISDAGGEATFVQADVTREADVEEMVETVVSTYGGLDFAHNNAGTSSAEAPLTEQTEEAWDTLYDLNLKAVWRCLKAEIPAMLEDGGGAIVNTASVAGLGGHWNLTPYAATKHGVVGLTRTAALEFSGDGVRVNAVCPGVVKTEAVDRLQESDPERLERMSMGRPMDRLGKPEEVASAVVWLCSDESSFVTGHPLAVDGGITALH